MSLIGVLAAAVCRAAEVMRELSSLGLRPGVVIYTTLLNAYGVAGDVAAAHQVLHDMRAAGVPPNNFTYSSLMALYSLAGNLPKILVGPPHSFWHDALCWCATPEHASCQTYCFLCFAVCTQSSCFISTRICSICGFHTTCLHSKCQQPHAAAVDAQFDAQHTPAVTSDCCAASAHCFWIPGCG